MNWFKKITAFIITMELIACVYLTAFCRPAPEVIAQAPSDHACEAYLAKENAAWLAAIANDRQSLVSKMARK